MDHSDEELLKAIALKDEKAFKIFYDRYVGRLHACALKYTRDSDISNDIVQNFWISFWMDPGIIKTDDKGMAWSYLKHYFSYRILDYLRSAAAHALGNEDLLNEAEESLQYTHVMEELEANEIRSLIQRVLAGLPSLTEEIFNLLWEKNHSVKEVAKKYHISEKMVRLRYKKALFAIRTKILEMHSDHTHNPKAGEILLLLISIHLLK